MEHPLAQSLWISQVDGQGYRLPLRPTSTKETSQTSLCRLASRHIACACAGGRSPCQTAASGPGRHPYPAGYTRRTAERRGRLEREPAAADGADLLILACDGDRTRLGPKSPGPASRFPLFDVIGGLWVVAVDGGDISSHRTGRVAIDSPER